MPPSTPQLATRRPTGLPAVPQVVVHGPSKSGRTVATAKLSLAPWVDRFFVAQIGTQAWDDYGRFFPKVELLDHNGTASGVLDQIEAACSVPATSGMLNVVVVDDGTDHWDTHKLLAEARQRRNRRTQEALKADPDAEVDPTMDKWNDVKAKWARMFHLAKQSGTVFVIVCRGDYVAKVDASGNPVAGATEYRIEAEKSTLSRCLMSVRVFPDHRAVLEAITSIDPVVLKALADAGKAGYTLPDANPLGHAIELLRSTSTTGAWADGRQLVVGEGESYPARQAKDWLMATIKAMAPTLAADVPAWKLAGASLWSAAFDGQSPPSDELNPAQRAHLERIVPQLITERFLGGVAPVAEPEPMADPVDDSPPEPEAARPEAPTTCPDCHGPHHHGPCSTPAAAEPAPERERRKAAATDADLDAMAREQGAPTMDERAAERRRKAAAVAATLNPTAAADEPQTAADAMALFTEDTDGVDPYGTN